MLSVKKNSQYLVVNCSKLYLLAIDKPTYSLARSTCGMCVWAVQGRRSHVIFGSGPTHFLGAGSG